MKKRILLFCSFFLCCASFALAQQNRAYTGGSGDGYAMAEIRVHSQPTGLEKSFSQAVQLYPNPLKKGEALFLQVEAGAKIHRIFLRDSSGKLLYEKDIPPHNESLQLSLPTARLPAGIYLLQLSGPDVRISKKIMLL